jgi:transposase-like protein
MRISTEERNKMIIELYKRGASYSDIQRRYKVSSKTIAKLVKGIEVKCQGCGTLKGKKKFQEHHTDRENRPNDTILLCIPCHVKADILLREKAKTQISPSLQPPPLSSPSLHSRKGMTLPESLHPRRGMVPPVEPATRSVSRGEEAIDGFFKFFEGASGIAEVVAPHFDRLPKWGKLAVAGGAAMGVGALIKVAHDARNAPKPTAIDMGSFRPPTSSSADREEHGKTDDKPRCTACQHLDVVYEAGHDPAPEPVHEGSHDLAPKPKPKSTEIEHI